MERQGFELVEDGSWFDIVTFCRRLSVALESTVSKQEVERFEEWRPKPKDSGKRMRQKTAEEAAVKETQVEKKSEGTVQEMSQAGKNMQKTGKDVMAGNAKDGLKDAEDAGTAAARGIMPIFIRAFRILEEMLYVNVMGRTNPSYFESEVFAVALERDLLDHDHHTVRIRFDSEDLLDDIEQQMQQ